MLIKIIDSKKEYIIDIIVNNKTVIFIHII